MARYRGPVKKLSRNAGTSLDGFPKAEHLNRAYPSGQHGQARKKVSEYAVQLQEKQKVRRTYGLLEKQFRHNYEAAVHKKGVTGTVMLQRLESRLDNIVYRSGLVKSRPQGRQLIVHGHVTVNGRKVDIPSCLLRPGDVVGIRERSRELFKTLAEVNTRVQPEWLTVDMDALTCTVQRLPERAEMDQTFSENLIIEFYSR